MNEKRSNFELIFQPTRGLLAIGGFGDTGSLKDVEIGLRGKFKEGPCLPHRMYSGKAAMINENIYLTG